MNDLRHLSRREFLKRTGQTTGGLVLALSFGACSRTPEPAADTSSAAENFMPNVYVNIRNDGTVEIHCHRSEMGQGIRTGLPQVIADELDADWDRIEVIQAPGGEQYGDQNTDGSTSIRQQFDLLRNAGASARDMLLTAAAARWQVDKAELTTHDHAVHHEASGRSAGYGELVAEAASLELPEAVAFKSPSEYRYIGEPMDLLDAFDMTTGRAMYGTDTVLPGMLYASIERPPVLGGTIAALDDTKARAVKGVVDVIRMPEATSPPVFNPLGGVAVLATNTWAAERGRKALEIEWDPGRNAEYDSATYKTELIDTSHRDGTPILNRGDVAKAFDEAATVHEADYYAPHLVHASMEPPAATARINADGTCDVWSCTQNPQAVQQTVGGLLGLDTKQVNAYVTLLGGAFGRKSKADFPAEAAWLARESGKPVKVTWTREDDIRLGYLHSVSAQYLRAGLDEDGKVTGWLHRTVFPSISSTFDSEATGPSSGETGLGFVDNPYLVPNMRLETGEAKAHVRIGWLRSVCNIYHAFAVCGFADELAHVAGADPKAFLLDLLGPDRRVNPADDGAEYGNYGQDIEKWPIDTARIKAVIDKTAEMAGWGRSLPEGRGLGIAAHRSFLSSVAAAAEVSVGDDGKIKVEELWITIDAGQVVNPDRVRAQMEGAGIFGISLALHGEITAKGGRIEQGNYDTYPVARFEDAPTAIHVHIMEVDAPPGGVGEPGVPPIAPAITNAYYAATGKRIRELPLRKAGIV
ncbi:MAG: molybdopterin cofactor-binding domain-containing protein [Woeseiaceae bacterium]|jgi:isoquinoline 1-oxidoreductase beta subunit|nr:molybdopterin cofactor-binding domain-containing protein [Woeseiaceae bacterium]